MNDSKTKTLYLLKRLTLLLCIAFIFSSCGAKLQTADQVVDLFAQPALTLTQKVQAVCSALASNQRGPKLDNIAFARDACVNPGNSAQNLSTTTDFSFTAVASNGQLFNSENPDPSQTDALLQLKTRSQIWMNRSIINVAANVANYIKEGQLSNSAPDEALKLEKLREPFFDSQEFYFITDMQFSMREAITLQNNVRIEGVKVNNSLVASVRTIESAAPEVSQFKDMRILVFIVPHANDIYIDILIDIDVYSSGLTSILEKEIVKSFSTAIDELIKKVFA